MFQSVNIRLRGFVAIPLAIGFAMLCGCGPAASVSGTVSFQGQTVNNGSVTFYSTADGPTAVGNINEDGAYELKVGNETGLPPGEYTVGVQSVKEWKEPKNPIDAKTPIYLLPAKFNDPKQSGLKYEVTSGANQIDIAIDG